MSSTRVAVVGLGNAGHDLHLPALGGIESATIVGACDLDQGKRERAAQRFAVPVFADLSAMLAEAKPEVVIIATPPASHVEFCERALAAGVHVVCEKPFAPSVAAAERVIEAARRAGKRVALNHEFREMAIFSAVRAAAAAAGGPVFAQAWQNMDLPPWKEPGWRGSMLTGTLYEAGLHLVDWVLALFGEKPSAVQATMSSCGAREERSDAVALVTLEFSRGRLAQVIQNRLCPGETQYFEVRVDAPRTSLRASFGGRARISAGMYRSTKPHLRLEMGASGIAWSEVGHSRTMLGSNPREPAMEATRALLRKTLAAFASGAAAPASGEDGRDTLETIAACYLAAASGRRVVLADEATRLRGLDLGDPLAAA